MAMATQAKQSVHAGHTITIKIKGVEVGFIQSGEGNRSFGQEGLYGIGSIMPQEHVPLRYEGGFTVQSFFMKKKSLYDLKITAIADDILQMDVIDIEVTDNLTLETVRVYEGCSLNTYSETFQVGAISGQNAAWVYLRSR
jgi:hypothetical protein